MKFKFNDVWYCLKHTGSFQVLNGNPFLKTKIVNYVVGRQNRYSCERKTEKGNWVGEGGTLGSVWMLCTCYRRVWRGQRGRKGEQGRGGQQREAEGDRRWHLSICAECEGGKGGSQWEGLCEAQPTCWSSVPGPTPIVHLRKAHCSWEAWTAKTCRQDYWFALFWLCTTGRKHALDLI